VPDTADRYPSSNKWVAKECLKVWHVARFAKPA